MLHAIRSMQRRRDGKSHSNILPVLVASLSLLVLGIALMWAR